MKVRSLQIGLPREVVVDGRPRFTAFRKEAAAGRVALRADGLAGDAVGNPKVHGGADKAVCCYPFEHYGYWQAALEVRLGPAAFGENFTTEGLTEEIVHVGDLFRVGTAMVQVTQPRQPCSTLARIWDRKGFVKEVEQSGRTGFYLRVVEEGEVAAGDPITLVEIDAAAITIAEANAIHRNACKDPAGVKRLLAVAALSDAWRTELEKRLRASE